MSAASSALKTRWMIYGSNGYTGRLAARLPRPEGMPAPILAGRNAESIKSQAESLKFDYRIFDLTNPAAIDKALEDVQVLVLAAGPFVHTSAPLVEACLRTKTHYLDITGEYEVFESIHSRNQQAKDAGVVLLPGIGLDVVPTDCLAARLKEELPTATHLQMLLMPSGSGISPGTTKTMLLMIAKPTIARVGGVIKESPRKATELVNWTSPSGETISSSPMSWGDVSTAYHSTGIPNIEIFLKLEPSQAAARSGWSFTALRYMASWSAGRWVLNKAIEKFIPGPSEDQNRDGRFNFLGIAWDDNSKEAVELSLATAEGYQLTAWSMITAANKLLTTHKDASGAHTPSTIFGKDYIMEFEHSSWGNVQKSILSDEKYAERRF